MSNPHPLDIFRSSEQGFDAASRLPRKRRTVTGKIVRTQARPAPAAAALSKAGKGAKAGRRKPARSKPARPASSPRISNRALLYTALALVTMVTGWVVIPQWFGDDGAESGVVPLRRETVFSTRDRGTPSEPPTTTQANLEASTEAPVKAPAPPKSEPAASKPEQAIPTGPMHYTVLVATYKGSHLSIAQGTARELRDRGFDDVRLLGYDDSGSGGYTRVELVVGSATGRAQLDRLRDELRAIDDWGTGRESKPFHDARVIEHPNPDPS